MIKVRQGAGCMFKRRLAYTVDNSKWKTKLFIYSTTELKIFNGIV